jgi:type 1 fimbriae regulatory protein FimB
MPLIVPGVRRSSHTPGPPTLESRTRRDARLLELDRLHFNIRSPSLNMYAFSKDEIMRLLGAARAASERDFLMILVAYLHGLRASEVIAITRDHVSDGHLDARRLKGSEHTVQPLISHENPLLNERKGLFEYSQFMYPNQRLFPISRQHFWRLVQKHGKTAGLPRHKCHPHTMKHTIGVELSDAKGLPVTQTYLGHKSGASTMIYTKKSPEQAAAAVREALGAEKPAANLKT